MRSEEGNSKVRVGNQHLNFWYLILGLLLSNEHDDLDRHGEDLYYRESKSTPGKDVVNSLITSHPLKCKVDLEECVGDDHS